MPTNEQITRLGIFVAVGYLCAGILVSIFASLPYWVAYFESSFLIGSVVVVASLLVGATVGIALIRYLVPRYGIKSIFEQDVLIMMIGLLFIALAMNQAMIVIGLLITSGAMSVYFYENFSTQTKAAREGGVGVMTLGGWALGPIVAVVVIALLGNYGLITLRALIAHYIVISFWVWVQRLGLHMDYQDVPESILRLVKNYQQAQQRDEYNKKTRHGAFPIAEEKPAATKAPESTPAAAKPAAPAPVKTTEAPKPATSAAATASSATPSTSATPAAPSTASAPAASAATATKPAASSASPAATTASAAKPAADNTADSSASAAPATTKSDSDKKDAPAASATDEAKSAASPDAAASSKSEAPKKKRGFFGRI